MYVRTHIHVYANIHTDGTIVDRVLVHWMLEFKTIEKLGDGAMLIRSH